MHDIDEMIVTTSKHLPAPAAGDQAASVSVVAVAPSWVRRRLGRFTTSASRNRGCRTPKGLPQPPTTQEAAAAHPAAASQSWARAPPHRGGQGGPAPTPAPLPLSPPAAAPGSRA